MIKASYSLSLTESLYENDLQRTNDLNFSLYFETLDRYVQYTCPVHWHGELEICVVTKGRLLAKVGCSEIALSAGDGVFINADTLHGYERLEEGTYFITILFDASFIVGSRSENSLYKKYMLPILQSAGTPCICLTRAVDWQKDILQKCLEVYRLAEREEYGYELLVRSYLSSVVLAVNSHIKTLPAAAYPVSSDTYIPEMVQFIRDHYAEKIAIADIARAANISARECFRRFQKSMRTSPTRYLETIRLMRAIALLTESNENVKEICYQSGFFNASYFCKRFRALSGMTPTQYREKRKCEPSPQGVRYPF